MGGLPAHRKVDTDALRPLEMEGAVTISSGDMNFVLIGIEGFDQFQNPWGCTEKEVGGPFEESRAAHSPTPGGVALIRHDQVYTPLF